MKVSKSLEDLSELEQLHQATGLTGEALTNLFLDNKMRRESLWAKIHIPKLTMTDDAIEATKPEFEGTVRWFDNKKGYGFCSDGNGNVDYFVHISCLSRCGLTTLKDGQRVRFDTEADRENGKTKISRIELVV